MPRRFVFATVVALAALVLTVSLVRLHWLRRDTPPGAGDPSWQWAGAAPGMNVYFAVRSEANTEVVAWVDQRYFKNPAGIDKDIVELRQFDCRRHASRRLSEGSNRDPKPDSARDTARWASPRDGSPAAQVLASLCHPQVSVVTASLLGS
jgi:hypothetical protein